MSSNEQSAELRLPTADLRTRIVLNGIVGLALLVGYIALVSQAEMVSGPLIYGLILLGIEARLGLRIAAHCKLIRRAQSCRSPRIELTGKVVHLPAVVSTEQEMAIPLQDISRCVVKEREKRWGKRRWDFVVEQKSPSGLVCLTIEDWWFPGGESQMRGLAVAVEHQRQATKSLQTS
jgi:hypothetical protein